MRTVAALLPENGSRIALLTGSIPAEEARRIRQKLAGGEIDLVIGTSALLSPATQFRRLGLAIVDEQHRFGVEQREQLASKGKNARLLGISATPIPRTLALLSYPGWEVSNLEGRADSRGAVETRLIPVEKRSAALQWIAKKVRSGLQAICIRPRIEGEKEGALAFHRQLSQGEFQGLSLGLVHGGQAHETREKTLRRFAGGAVSALVATTIVEVGIDVPGASILWIEGAESLGLAQLHQLRGRIARRGQKGYCFVVPSPSSSPRARARLEMFRDVDDGLRLAEIDLADRGPGEILGLRQSGQLGIVRGFAEDPQRLLSLMEKARRTARELAKGDGLRLDASLVGCHGRVSTRTTNL
jgi:ATP-dependent DNA helicase RecG